jgi:hypothetical protein
MPITLAGSERRRAVDRDSGAGPGAGSADGSIERWRAVGRDAGAAVVAAGSAQGSTVVAGRRGCAGSADGVFGAAGRGDAARAVGSAVAGSAQGSTVVAGWRGCAARTDGVVGTAGWGDVIWGAVSVVRGAAGGPDRVDALGGATSLPVAGATGGVAFRGATRAAGLFESKGGGSVGFLTWSAGGVESAGPTLFGGGDIGAPLCA